MANGTERRGSRTSPASTVVPSKPKNANAASKMAVETSGIAGVGPGASDAQSTNTSPTTTKATSGAILSTVNVVLTAAVWRIPRTLTHVYASTSALIAAARVTGS